MKRSHRLAVSLGIIATAAIGVLYASVHVAASIGVLTNLLWLWDDKLDNPIRRRKPANDNVFKQNFDCYQKQG